MTKCLKYEMAAVVFDMSNPRKFAMMRIIGILLILCVFSSTAASVLDIFPDIGVSAASGSAVCSFDYEPSGSEWTPGIDEKMVFLASIQGDGWKLGVGKGGQVYSLRGPFGESIPPQRVESPWNDEVWQFVATDETLVGPLQEYQNANPSMRSATLPLMYFIHQAGIYIKGSGFDAGSAPTPFYSPCLRKRWNSETKTLELVNWMQQARTPCVWKSGALIYTAFRDVGNGVIEVNQVVHNFGEVTLNFLNTPWGGVRKSSLPVSVLSKPDGSQERVGGMFGWTDIPTRDLKDTGGWIAWTQDPHKDQSPALALVFGMDLEDNAHGKINDQVIRWGTAGGKERDYEVVERICYIPVKQGDSISICWYLVTGEFATVWENAEQLSEKAGVRRIEFEESARQSVWIGDGKVTTDGQGEPWIGLCAFPVKGTVPVFLLEDKRTGEQIITADPYALAETEPFPNPLPEDLPIHDIYNNRILYKQYLPYIGYENLLGYAFIKKSSIDMQKLELPPETKNIRLHKSAQQLWLKK